MASRITGWLNIADAPLEPLEVVDCGTRHRGRARGARERARGQGSTVNCHLRFLLFVRGRRRESVGGPADTRGVAAGGLAPGGQAVVGRDVVAGDEVVVVGL